MKLIVAQPIAAQLIAAGPNSFGPAYLVSLLIQSNFKNKRLNSKKKFLFKVLLSNIVSLETSLYIAGKQKLMHQKVFYLL